MQKDYNDIAAKEEKQAKLSTDRGRYALYLALVLVVVSVLVYASNKWSGNQPIRDISVQGNSIVSDSEITRQIQTPVLNSINNKINLEAIYDEIRDNPFVSSSFVMHSGSDRINIQIDEKQPRALVVNADGTLAYTDEFGSILPYRLLPQAEDLPVIRNSPGKGAPDSLSIKGALRILGELIREENEILYVTTSEIVYNPENKTYSLVSADNGIKVIFGGLNNLEDKMSNLLSFWRSVMPQETPGRIKYIDLRWLNQVVVDKPVG